MLTFFAGLVIGAVLAVAVFGLLQTLFGRPALEMRSGRLEMLNALPDPMALSEHGRIVFKNDAWRREIDSLTTRAARTQGASPALSAGDARGEGESLHDWLSGLGVDARELVLESPADAVRRGALRADKQLRLADGRVLHWLATPFPGLGRRLELNAVRDVTAWASADFDQAVFLDRATHELKTPITAIKGYAELFSMYTQSGRNIPPDIAVRLVQQSDRLVHLVNQLLDISRLGAGRLSDTAVPLRLDDLLDDVVERIREWFPNRAIRVDSEPLPAALDPDRFEQIVRELVFNALQYSAPEEPVDVSLSKHDERIVLKVEDRGSGVRREDSERMLERFTRGVNVTRFPGAGGFGLGLYLASRVLERWGGQIKLQEREGGGTRAVAEWTGRPVTAEAWVEDQPRLAANPSP
jgi:signal transduction histidine kinase